MHDHAIKMQVWKGVKPEAKSPTMLTLNNVFRVVCLCFGVLVALIVAYFISKSPAVTVMPIQHIEIKNELNNERAIYIDNLLESLKTESFLSIDLDKPQRQLQSLSWVDEAYVSRQWPDRIVVDIVEARPIAIWKDQNINLQGKVFTPDDIKRNLPVFDVPKEKIELAIREYLILQKVFVNQGLYIDVISMDRRGSIKVSLDNDVTVILGVNNIEQRSRLAVFIMKKNALQNRTIDMRYENGFAMRETQQIVKGN